jgi:undecaprenyl diphosphate synthase
MAKAHVISLPTGTKVPDHIAMILDGNRRWARSRGLQPWEGHRAGYEAIKTAARAARKMGVHTFTVWAFSTENWERSDTEVNEIMKLLRFGLDEMEPELHDEKVRLVHLGRKDRLPVDAAEHVARIEAETAQYTDHVFNLAVDYGGRDEILRAVNKIVGEGIKNVDEKSFEKYLDTHDQPYPYVDLFIRTSGEQRTSGLLPWQMTYAEYFWETDHLPDFTPSKLRDAILDYSRRRRRFGGNDVEEHLKFDPKIVADLDIKWKHALDLGEGERLRDLAVRYVKEHYGLSKELALEAGKNMAEAVLFGKKENWKEAKKNLITLYAIVQKTLNLAMEPEIVANIEVNLWRTNDEAGLRDLLAEKFRFSHLQAAKSAHLGFLANSEVAKKDWTKARNYMEKFYTALKERVA